MTNETSDRHASLIKAHHTRIRALMAGDLEQLSQVVGEDMIYISPFGRSQTRADVIANIQAGALNIERMDSYDISTRIYGDIGILIYRADAKMRNGDDIVEGVTRSTTIYEMRPGGWQMISQHQSTAEAD